jgi:uncharacterized protein YndB with AHSA1/START domain
MTSNLSVTTPTEREIVITRVFDAPRSVVFEAMSQPEFLKRWLLGPPGWSMTVCENDLQVGGKFRHVWSGPEGAEMAMHGVYREVVKPEKVVRTETFEMGCGGQAGEQLGTLHLLEQGGKTKLTLTLLFPNQQARDATIASGMEQGITAGYNRLDEVLGELTTSRAG